jgi:hypothetical protein
MQKTYCGGTQFEFQSGAVSVHRLSSLTPRESSDAFKRAITAIKQRNTSTNLKLTPDSELLPVPDVDLI